MISWPKLRGGLVLGGIFLAGFAAGALTALRIERREVVERHHPQPPSQVDPQQVAQTDRMGGMLLRQWIEPLALKPEQIEALRPAIERTARELSELRRENLRASQEVITAFERRVVEQLTPEQVHAFEKLREERRERWRRFQDRPRREDAPRREEAPPSRGVNRPRPEPQPKD